MATTHKKGSNLKKPKLRRSGVKPSQASQAQTIAKLRQELVESLQRENAATGENARLFQELEEALGQQAATSEILSVISSSPADVQPVLDVIAENAAGICGTPDVAIFRVEGDSYRVVATYGSAPVQAAGETRTLDRGSVVGRAMVERQTIHIHDIRAVQDDFWRVKTGAVVEGLRTMLAIPLLREGIAVGAIVMRRTEVNPFTDKQIALLKTFAAQAVIAIENARLFNELKESLEQQTATSQILGVIASSPTDIQPVLDVVAESAARLCEADDAIIRRLDGNVMPLVAHYGQIPPGGMDAPTVSPRDVVGRAIIGRQPIHLHDLAAAEVANEFPDSKFAQERSGARTFLTMPMLREGTPVGVINIRRQEVRPFSEKHIALLKTFADQAVIAIENVRLFKEIQERNAELREALEHQTATAEVLGIISRSPTDVQPVLDAIVESAARVCGIDDVVLRLHEGNVMIPRAHFGSIPIGRVEISVDEPQVRWMREHGTLHIPDAEAQNEFPTMGSVNNVRTYLAVPLRQQGELIGRLIARRIEVRPFT
ncbi:MAG: GAF domain-containing protein, partial [Candidatus Binatia bacterium]